jgi:hypothetical protein
MHTPQDDLQQTVAQIHAAPQRLVLAFAGAGSLALWWLHQVGGSSRTVLEATDHYSAASLRELLGALPAKAVSAATARAMAERTWARALHLSRELADQQHQAVPVLGVACTAAIASDYPRRGAHQAIIAIQTAAACSIYTLTLAKGHRDRLGEEALVSRLLLYAIARACELAPPPLNLAADDSLHEETTPATDPLARLLAGELSHVLVHPNGQHEAAPAIAGALLSGSFRPLHEGHEQLLAAATAELGQPGLFELPVANADKGTLIAEEVQRRLRQFAGRAPVVLSRAALFVEKARLFPGCVFVVGYDTAIRLVNPRYYGGAEGLHAAFEAIAATGCRFLVAGRAENGQFRTLDDVTLPPGHEELFAGLPEAAFRADVSSTALRELHDEAPE